MSTGAVRVCLYVPYTVRDLPSVVLGFRPTCTRVCVRVRTCVYMCACVCTRMCVRVRACVRARTYTCVCVRVLGVSVGLPVPLLPSPVSVRLVSSSLLCVCRYRASLGLSST